MATILAQGDDSLWFVDPITGVDTELTLPSGVTLSTDRQPRFAVLKRYAMVAHTPSVTLAVSPAGTVRKLFLTAPTTTPVLAAAGTGLTGVVKVRYSNVVKDADDNVLFESEWSEEASITLNNENLSISSIATSGDTITGRRVYRTLINESTYFHLDDIDDNVTTVLVSTASDASLPTVASEPVTHPEFGATSGGDRMKLICSWKNRLWAVSDADDDSDDIAFSEDGKIYDWPNQVSAYPEGQEVNGVVAFAPRRDQLGVLKRGGVWQITGDSNSNWRIIQIGIDKAGCISQESVVVVNDEVFWLGLDGVYHWSADGIRSITDEKVAPWFKTDRYFNRTRFANAFGKYNALRNQYELHLAAAGSSSEDRWVAFNLTTRQWYGPHRTAAFTPRSAADVEDDDGIRHTFMGGTNGLFYEQNSGTFTDEPSSAVDMDVITPAFNENNPDVDHYWGELSMLTQVETAGTLTVTPTLGDNVKNGLVQGMAQDGIAHALTAGRERLRRIGESILVQFRLRQATNAQGCAIYGMELPNHELGRR